MTRWFILLACITAAAPAATAQEPPPPAAAAAVDSPRAERRTPPPRRWSTSIDLGFTSSTGNTQLTALTTGFRLRHLQTRIFKLDWSANFRYGESQGEVVARHLQSKLDFDMGPGARVAPYIAASAERDAFRRLDLRSRVGSGVRYAFYARGNGEASLRLAALYSHERFTPAANRDPRSDGAWSLELKGQQGIGESAKLENTSAWEPVMGELGDYNVEIRTKLTSRVTRRLALTLQHQYSYDSTPPADVGSVDQRFQAGLTIEF